MLVNCPECNNQVSHEATTCPHCGYNVIESTIKKYPFNGEFYDLSFMKDKTMTTLDKFFMFGKITNAQKEQGDELLKLTFHFEEIFNSKKVVESSNSKNILKCPKCKSTAITTGARGVNHFWGFLGASKTVNRCGNCGHTWEPRG